MARVVGWLLPGDDAQAGRGGHQAAAAEVRPGRAWLISNRRLRIASSTGAGLVELEQAPEDRVVDRRGPGSARTGA
jgi:hypothetical protein